LLKEHHLYLIPIDHTFETQCDIECCIGINILIEMYQACTCTEASRCLPGESEPITHESIKRLLERQPHHTEALYDEAKSLIRLRRMRTSH
jgi:hypothetical protein